MESVADEGSGEGSDGFGEERSERKGRSGDNRRGGVLTSHPTRILYRRDARHRVAPQQDGAVLPTRESQKSGETKWVWRMQVEKVCGEDTIIMETRTRSPRENLMDGRFAENLAIRA